MRQYGREQLLKLYNSNTLSSDNSSLYKVFNRDYTNAFLSGVIDKNMFIDNPRDHSAIHLADGYSSISGENLERAKKEIYEERTGLIRDVKNKIDKLSIAKTPLKISVSGESGFPLMLSINTPENSFVVHSETNLTTSGKQPLNRDMLLKSLKALNDTGCFIEQLELDNLPRGLFLPFKDLNSLKKIIIFHLNGLREYVDPIDLPVLKTNDCIITRPSLSILISSPEDLHLCTAADIYFQLPNGVKEEYAGLIDLFSKNKRLIPWFPSILIGTDYSAAVNFLREVHPDLIVTNNLGVANVAGEIGISWIAGPYLNSVNSFSLLCLKKNPGCTGAFISNEINEQQIKSIKKPDNFNLYYSIYHPIVLMTSRQCLFHQITGCEKDAIDDTCIGQCESTATITSLKNVPLRIDKSKGNYHCIYNDINYLNTDILKRQPNLFTGVFIDLRDIRTGTIMESDKSATVKLFENCLSGSNESVLELHRSIHPTTNIQYTKGI